MVYAMSVLSCQVWCMPYQFCPVRYGVCHVSSVLSGMEYAMSVLSSCQVWSMPWVVFTRSYRRCCICSANYCKFRLISLLVWLVDVIALFLVMWPLSWYQFCVSLPLEVRTVGLVLFLQVLTLLSVLHCLPPAGHVEPVFSDRVFTAAVRRNNRELHNTEKKVLFATCAAPVPRYTRHDLLSLETAAAPPSFLSPQLIARLSHLGIARNVPRKPRRSRRGGKNERRKIKVIVGFRDRLSSDSSSSPTPCQHTTSVPPSSPPSDHDDLSASSLSAPLRPPHRQLLHIPLSSSSAENTLLVCLFNARSVGTSRRRSDISTFIQDNNVDIMLLTETWLRPAGDEAKIADLAPPGYLVLSFPRSAGGSGAKGGGIAFVIRDSLKPHVATTSSFPVHNPCFETAQLTLTYNKQLTNLFCIYRPPPSKKNKFSDSISFPTSLNTPTVCLAKHSLWVTLTFILKT